MADRVRPALASLDFTAKLVVITGVGRAGQVGEVLAASFAARGATLALLDRDASEVAARADALRAQGHAVTAHAADLSDAAQAREVASAVLGGTRDRFGGGVHAVICAAGGFASTGAVDSTEPDAWHRQFVINLDTAYSTTRAFLPALRIAHGSLVYFASAASLGGGDPGGIAAYAAAKSGVITLMQAVAADEQQHGVRANAVAPTAVRTDANLDSMGGDTRYVERESVADVVAFLASDLARNVTGQVVRLA